MNLTRKFNEFRNFYNQYRINSSISGSTQAEYFTEAPRQGLSEMRSTHLSNKISALQKNKYIKSYLNYFFLLL